MQERTPHPGHHCQWCGELALHLLVDGPRHAVVCDACGMTGPSHDGDRALDRDEAVARYTMGPTWALRQLHDTLVPGPTAPDVPMAAPPTPTLATPGETP
jgi:hypothetical protein